MRYIFTTSTLKKIQTRITNVSAAALIGVTGLGGALPLFFAPTAFAVTSTITVCASGCDQTDIQTAVNAANPGDTVQLKSDQSINSQITITKPLTLDGNGYTVSPSFSYTDNSNNSSIGVIGTSGVTITNLTVNGAAGTKLHGINIYESTNVILNKVTSENNAKDGVVVNGSTVTVEDLSTADNGWGGIDVDQGTGVTLPAQLTVRAGSYQQEIAAIVVDDTSKNVLVNDTENQYTYTDYSTTRIYTQIPTGISNQSPASGTYSTTANLKVITWNAATSPHGPLTYYYQSAHSNAVNPDGSFTLPAYTSGPLNTTQISTANTPAGVYYWHVRAQDSLGDYSTWTSPWVVTVDNTAPSIPSATLKNANGMSVPSNGYINTKNFTFNLSDTSADVTRYQLKYWNNIPGSAFNGENHAWSVSNLSATGHMSTLGTYTDLFTQGEGTHYFAFSACDAAGNCSAYTTPSFVVTYDATAPVVAITNPSQNDEVNGIVQITGTITDTNPNHYYLVILDQNNKVVAGPGVVNSPATSFTYNWDTSKLKDGAYIIDLEARDAAGNKGPLSTQQITVTTKNAPIISDNFSVNLLTGTKFTLSPTVKHASPVTYQWQVSGNNNNKLQPLVNPNESLTDPTLEIGPAPKGNYTVTLTVTDAAGNVATKDYDVTVSTPAQPENHNDAQVLGAQTVSNTQTPKPSNLQASNDSSLQNGKVLGANTTTTPTSTGNNNSSKDNSSVNIQNAANTKKTSLLQRLGWWLILLPIALVLIALIVFVRSGSNKKSA